MDLASINVKFGANTSGFTSGLGSMQSAMRGFSASAPMLLAGVGIAIAALAVKMGVDAVKAAADFQQGLNRLITGAGDTTDNMQKMGLAWYLARYGRADRRTAPCHVPNHLSQSARGASRGHAESGGNGQYR